MTADRSPFTPDSIRITPGSYPSQSAGGGVIPPPYQRAEVQELRGKVAAILAELDRWLERAS
jgi:hypothetical protein